MLNKKTSIPEFPNLFLNEKNIHVQEHTIVEKHNTYSCHIISQCHILVMLKQVSNSIFRKEILFKKTMIKQFVINTQCVVVMKLFIIMIECNYCISLNLLQSECFCLQFFTAKSRNFFCSSPLVCSSLYSFIRTKPCLKCHSKLSND